MRPPPPRPRPPLGCRTVGALALLAVVLGGAGGRTLASATLDQVPPAPPPAPLDDKRFEGEFGLYVKLVPDGIEARWLTDDTVPGVVRVWANGAVTAEVTTEPGTSHSAALEADDSEVILEYGSADGPRYRTHVELRAPKTAPVDVEAPDSVYVFGDVHGEFDRVAKLLRRAGLIDAELRWTGGSKVVAFLGDILDRGPDVTGVLWLLYRLDREATAAGGGILVVLGNHELMIMSGDVRYVHGGEASIAFRHRVRYKDMFHPTESVIGRWLASKPGLMRLGDLLLAHGGMSPAWIEYSLGDFRDTLRGFLAESLFVNWDNEEYLLEYARTSPVDSAGRVRRWEFFFDRQSVFWYRDLVLADTLGGFLEKVLDRYDVNVHIVAHTPGETIRERYEGDLVAVDLLDAAAEMLLLVRDEDGGWTRYKVPLEGEPVLLPPAPPAAPPPLPIDTFATWALGVSTP